MGRPKGNLAILLLLLLGVPTSGARAQDRSDARDYDEIDGVVRAFLDAVTDNGISLFEGLAFPCYLVVPGLAQEIAVFEDEADLEPPGTSPGFETRDMSIRLAGKAAVVTFQFRPPETPSWATATLLMTRPTGIWVVQGIAMGANQRPEDVDLDIVRALRTAFLGALTTEGPVPFDGLGFPFLFYNGRAGTVQLIDGPEDLAAGGDPLDIRAHRVHWAYADTLATAVMELARPDDPEGPRETAGLVCAKWELGWHAVALIAGPAGADGPGAPPEGNL